MQMPMNAKPDKDSTAPARSLPTDLSKLEIEPERIGTVEHTSSFSPGMFFVFIVGVVFVLFGSYFAYVSKYQSDSEQIGRTFTKLNISVDQFDSAQILKLTPILREYTADYCDPRSKYKLIARVAEAGFLKIAAKLSVDQYEQCAKDIPYLAYASTYYQTLGEYPKALEIINRAIELDPAGPNYRYRRGKIYEALGNYDKALIDQISALDLLGKPQEIGAQQFYEIATMYAALKRFCEAATPLDTYISFNPATRRTPQLARLIDEYLSKGNCKQQTGSDDTLVRLRTRGATLLIEGKLNGVSGVFILDTGASFVTVTKSFADKARIVTNVESKITMQTANGLTTGILATANTIQVGGAYSGFIPVVVSDDTKLVGAHDPENIVGLLGMSFLSRFEMTIARGSLELRGKKF